MKTKSSKQNNTSMKSNQGLQISLILLIIFLLICNVTKFMNNLNRNKDNLNRYNNLDTFSDQINYMENPKCENNSYCPNRHPNIPCHLVKKKCSKNNNYDDKKYRIKTISLFSKFVHNLSNFFKLYDEIPIATSAN